MKSEPQKEHQWLQKMIGDWTYEAECNMGPGQPSSKSSGAESVRSLGGLWVLADGKGQMPDGMPATMLMTIGYDPRQKKYVGSWVGSMMTHQWIYSGTLDETAKVLTLDCEGPSFSGDGTLARYQDVIEFKSDDHRILRSQTLGSDGTWNQFMTAHYRRKK